MLKQNLLLNIKTKNNKIKVLIFISFFISFFFNNNLISQEEASVGAAKLFKSTADSLYVLEKYELAIINYKKAMRISEDENWVEWYSSYSGLRKARSNAGNINIFIDEIAQLKSELVIDDSFIKGKVLFYQGFHKGNIGDLVGAISEYKQALIELTKVDDDNLNVSKIILSIYKNIGLNLAGLGDFKSAIMFCDLGIKKILESGNHIKLCEFHLSKAKYLYFDRNFKKLKIHLKESIKICDEDREKAFIYQYLADMYIAQDSLILAKKNIDISYKLDSNKSFDFFFTKAEFFKKNKQFEEAKNEFKVARNILNNQRYIRLYLKALVNYSNLAYLTGDKEESLNNAHSALVEFYPYLDSLNVFDRPKLDEVVPDVWIIEALHIKAKYFRDNYLETNDKFSLEEARYYYDLLLSHFDKLKGEYYSSSSKYRMGAYSQKIYSEVISFYIDQYSLYNDREDFENAFSLAQRGNSFVLRNAVSDRKALELAGVKKDSLDQYLQLASIVASDYSEDSTNGAKVLFEFDEYKSSLLSNYPSYGKYDQNQEISLQEAQRSLNEKSLFIKYYYYNNNLTVFGISKNSIFAENLSFSTELDSLVASNFSILSQDKTADSLAQNYLQDSKTIYDYIIGDLLAKYKMNEIEHLIVIPDGPLKKVSFNALAVNYNKDWNDPSTFLISKYALNYLFYSSQLKQDFDPYTRKDGFVGFGIEYEDDFLNEIVDDYMSSFKDTKNSSRQFSLNPLKYADDEVLATADILKGTTFINEKVTPSRVLSNINNFDVVHFSAHAFVDEEDYLNSFVVLNKDDSDNYQLRYSDILNLDIDSELVVLSACQTSSGKSVEGEGLMSLSRAFVQSGSKASVGAYWNAPDYATKELMSLFYSNLNEGMTKSKALQQAQIEYLTNDEISSPTIRSPFFWASWAIYGGDQPLKMNSKFINFTSINSTFLIVALGFLAFGLGRLFYLRSN